MSLNKLMGSEMYVVRFVRRNNMSVIGRNL